MKDSFLVYCSHYETIKLLSTTEKGELLDAIFLYNITGKEPETNTLGVKITFSFLKQQFDRNNDAYQRVTIRNSENGKKGGAPTGNNNASKKQAKTTQTTQTTQNKLYDNDNDSDNEREEKEKFPPLVFDKAFIPISEMENFLLSDVRKCDFKYSQYGIKKEEFPNYVIRFTKMLKDKNEIGKSGQNVNSHFSKWMQSLFKKPKKPAIKPLHH